jgi:hypothetical protein|tara:strand:+ start:1023 stop:1166 length:144 start_codon:yes stop_codon:yes gene_type:complete
LGRYLNIIDKEVIYDFNDEGLLAKKMTTNFTSNQPITALMSMMKMAI